MPKLRFSKKTYLDVTKEPLAGSSFVNWIRVLAENRLAVDWQFIPRAVYVTALSLIMSPLKISEKLHFDKIIEDVEIASLDGSFGLSQMETSVSWRGGAEWRRRVSSHSA